VTTPDPLAEVRAEFAAGLGRRIDTMRAALERLRADWHAPEAETLYRAAHSLTGTAGSFGAEALVHAAADLEALARGWLARGGSVPEEWRVAAAAITELDGAVREYRATAPPGVLRSPASRLAVVGELTSLINAAVDMREIFQGAILKVQRVLDFRRASVVLIDDTATHYYLHTEYDRARGGFVTREAVFPVEQGVTGEAIRSGRPIRIDSLPATEGILLQEGRRVSTMIVPLHVGDRVIGALNFGHEDPGSYSDEDLDWAVVLGRQIETSLYYSKLLSTIAEQRAALAREHAAVQGERNRLEALIDASDAAIMLVGRDRRIAHVNIQMARLLGVPTEAVLGAGLDTVHRFLAGSFVDPGALLAQESALSGNVVLRDRVEMTFPQGAVYQRVVAPVREGGSLLGHIVLYRDVTREVEGERAKSEFVSVVSHELRTPMTSVKTSLSLLLSGAGGPLEAPAHELLAIALRNTDRLIQLVNDLLDLSRLDAGRMEFTLESVTLGVAVTSSVEAVAAFAGEQGVTIAVAPPADDVLVHAVRGRLEQILVNLLSNAVKFSPRGGRVDVRWWRDGDAAVTEVADAGPGIPADKLEIIFEPFRQLDSSTTREHGGTGLGLSISHRIVEALGGRLWATSEPGAGSRFFVRLPLAPTPLRPAEPPEEGGRAARAAVVLLVHRDPDWQHLAAARLRAEGWRVVTAATGAEALARLHEAPVDLLVLGLELSDMHWRTVWERLQLEPLLFDLPTVIVGEPDTARATDDGFEATATAEGVVETGRRLLADPPRPLVLLVEDDPAAAQTLRKILRQAGYSCLVAPDAHRGLEFARARKPHLIVTDYQMPGMDGLAFLQELRRDPALQPVPAIMLTGRATPDLARKLREISVPRLAKPVKREALLAEIRARI
jgi:signal transduction histidine kinase/DNA-binding response OmpR family regulator/HPt (histidine-containing phosphotransfer) domain-containing protein